MTASATDALALPNVRRFIAFRTLFNARFYYPVFTIIFLDFGLTLEQFAILNTIWALTIVGLEVPSGALADTIGRRNLVVAAAAIMVVEVACIAFAPTDGSPIVFWLFVINRVLSGAAEAAASGADEALAYDSLKEKGLESQWGAVLEKQMRLQSIAFVVVMSLGAVLYDHDKLNWALSHLGLDLDLTKSVAMRLPLFGTLLFGVIALFATLGMKEPKTHSPTENDPSAGLAGLSPWKAIRKSMLTTLKAGSWILRTPMAFAIILSGLLFDHIVRMTLTLNSEYYRQVGIPEYTFGFIGSGLSLLGIFMPKLGQSLAGNRSRVFNFLFLATAIFVGLWLMARFIPYWSALAMVPVYAGIFLNGYFVSHYLNQITDSSQRATVLSFKGLAFNLAYGGIGFAYAAVVRSLRVDSSATELSDRAQSSYLFQTTFGWFPYYFLAAAALAFAVNAVILRRAKSQQA